MQIKLDFRGDKEFKRLDKLLGTLTAQRAKRVLRSALRYAVKNVVKDAKAGAPKDTGNLKKNIKSKLRKRTRRDTIAINVGPTKEAYYGYFQEYGYTLKTVESGSSKIPGKFFLRKAYKKNKEEIVKRFKKKFSEMIDKNINAMKAGKK